MIQPHKIVNGVPVALSQQEIDDKAAEDALNQAALTREEYKLDRRLAYEAAGWKTPFDIFDDMQERGVDTVLADRKAIQDSFPKPA